MQIAVWPTFSKWCTILRPKSFSASSANLTNYIRYPKLAVVKKENLH